MKALFILIILILLTSGIFFWWSNGTAAVNPSDASQKSFTVRSGEGTREIANKLKTSGLIRDPFVFLVLIKKTGMDGRIQAGEFALSPSMNASEILQRLQVGKMDIQITIPEGK